MKKFIIPFLALAVSLFGQGSTPTAVQKVTDGTNNLTGSIYAPSGKFIGVHAGGSFYFESGAQFSGSASAFRTAIGAGTSTFDGTFASLTGKPMTLLGYGITDPVVVTSTNYANPSWITSYAWSKLTGTPITLAGYGITDPVVTTAGSYSNPVWITSLAGSKVTGAYTANGQTLSSGRIIGRVTAATGAAEELLPTAVLDLIGSTRGQLLYRGASGWSVLAPGTAGYVLSTGGSGADPTWIIGGGGGGGGTWGSITGLLANQADLQAALDGKQPLNNKLTGVSAMAWGTNSIIYSPSSTTVSTITTANSGVLVTSAGGVPSIATDIPTAVTIGGAYSYRVGGTDVSVADGGTGLSAGTSGGILGYTASGVLASSAMLDAGQIILGGGVGALPATLGTLGTSTTVLHGNAAGLPSFGAIVLTADVSGTLPATNGGTSNGFTAFSGPAASTKTFTLPNANAAILTDNAAVTVIQGGTGRATGTNAYALVATGTTATGAQQSLAVGATTDLLVGGGAGALPAWTTATGTGAPVRATSPTLVTPALGTPSALVLTNATGLPIAGLSATGTPSSSTYLRGDNTWASVSGTGTVTVVGAGALTSTAIVTGGGAQALQTPAPTTATLDSSGNASFTSVTTGAGGSAAGFYRLGQGTAPSLGTTNITFAAPSSVTSYLRVLDGSAGSTGVYLGTVSGTTVTDTKVAPGTSGNVLTSNGTTWVSSASSGALPTINAQTGTAYTMVLGDANNFVTSTNASANTVTVPLNATVAYPVGTQIAIQRGGAGSTTIAATGGVTINSPSGLALTNQYGWGTLLKTGTDTWSLSTGPSIVIASGKTVTQNNSLTYAGTDATTMTFPTTSATIARTDAANTFTGTQSFGALTATTLNGNTFTAGTGTISIGAGKTVTQNSSITYSGTDSTTMTFPTTSASVARTDAGQTFAGNETFSGLLGVGGSTVSSSTNLNLPASTTGVSSLRVAHGAAPTAPVNGDLWSTTLGFYGQVNGSTVGPFIASGGGGSVPPINAQTGTAYTMVLTDAPAASTSQGFVTMSNASANTLTVPLNATVAFPLGTQIAVQRLGAGSTTIAATGGVTINSPSGLSIANQFAWGTLLKTGTDTWQFSSGPSMVVASGKTGTINNSLTFAGTDATTMTFPSTSASVARTDAGQTFTGTQTFGAAVATTLNGNTFTAGTYTLTGTAAKTLNFTNTLTLAGTDGTTMTFPGTSATIARTDAANTFTGTQTFGAVVGTTWNGNTWATGTGTLSIAAGKTLTSSNTLTLAGTDSTVMTFPGTSATIARTDAANTFTGASTTTSWTENTPVITGGLTASGSGSNDYSASTGAFKTSSGANQLSGAVTVTDATTPSVSLATGKTNTGNFTVNGKTSGSTILTTADATGQNVTISTAAQTTGASTLSIPDQAGTSRSFVFDTLAQTLTNKTLTNPVIGGASGTGSNNFDLSAGTGTFKTTTGAVTLGGGVNSVTTSGPSINTATARSSGVANYFTINVPADTGITAATEAIGYQHLTGTRTWATTGTVALQRENFFAGPTYASASASQTFTDAFNSYFTPPIAGTNAIFTRNHTLGIVDATSAASSITGGLVVATTLGTTATSVGIGGGNVNAGGLITGGTVTSTGALTAGATSITGAAATTALTVAQTARTSGILPYIKYTIPTDTAQTAATESPGIQGVTGTRTWATTGTVALQREIFFPGPTYASASASQTFTDAFNMYLTPPIAGTNAIFTRGHSLGIVDATSAASSITGGLVVATTLGTSATSVGIGGGNINAGGSGTFGGQLIGGGTTTNNAAAAGVIGETATTTVASGSAVSLTTATAANMTSVSLTAGDWDVYATFVYSPGATTSVTQLTASLGTTTGAITAITGGTMATTQQSYAAMVPTAPISVTVGPLRQSLSGTTTIFAVSQSSFTISTMSVYGTVYARRVR